MPEYSERYRIFRRLLAIEGSVLAIRQADLITRAVKHQRGREIEIKASPSTRRINPRVQYAMWRSNRTLDLWFPEDRVVK